MRTVFKSINILLSVVLVVIAAGIAYVAIPYFGNQALIVRSGSMTPTIDVGSIVVVHPSEKFISPIASTPMYNKGDIIAFRSEKNSKTIITHRVIGFETKGNDIFYKTKGDANKSIDGWVVREKNILGKTYFVLPQVGNLLAFAKSGLGFPLLIVMPAIFVVLLEIYNIAKEIRKNMKPPVHNFPILKILIPFLILGFAIPIAFAFSSDTEKSTNNIFAAAEVFSVTPSITPTLTPTSTPAPFGIADHVVISEVQITAGPGITDHDFVEFYNPTSSPFDLNGHRLVKRTGSSLNDTTLKSWTSSAIIPAHGFYLWASSDDGYGASVGADASTTENIGASNSIALRFGAMDTGTIIDALSWNSGANSLKEETEFSPNPGTNQSMERKALSSSDATSMGSEGSDQFKGNGYDTNNNSADFILRSLSQPQSSTSSAETL